MHEHPRKVFWPPAGEKKKVLDIGTTETPNTSIDFAKNISGGRGSVAWMRHKPLILISPIALAPATRTAQSSDTQLIDQQRTRATLAG